MERWRVTFLHTEAIPHKVRQAAVTEQDCPDSGARETAAASRQAAVKLPNRFLSFLTRSKISILSHKRRRNAFVSFLFPLITKGRPKKVHVTGEEVK